nr:hypothetical protein [Actinomycetota bacterium]
GAVLGALLIGQGAQRAIELGDAAGVATELGSDHEQIFALVDERGAHSIRACPPVVVGAIQEQTALAWALDLPIAAVDVARAAPVPGVQITRDGDRWAIQLESCPNPK